MGLRICYFNSGYLPDRGGVATFAGGLAEHMALAPEVSAVKVIAFKNSQPRYERRGDKLEIFTFGAHGFWTMFWLVAKYVLRFRKFEIFHATNIFPVGFFVLLLAKLILRRKVFVTLHGTDAVTTGGTTLVRWAKRFTLLHADRALANSRSTMMEAAKRQDVSLKRFAVVYPGVNNEFFAKTGGDARAKHNLQPEDFVVLTACQLIKRKAVDDLIRAVSSIRDRAVKLVVVGKGPEEGNLRKLAADLGLLGERRVIFAGSVDDLGGYYRAADVFVLASRYLAEAGDIEGLGLVLLEAQAFGLPVIGARSGGIPETFLNGTTGFLVEERDVRTIAEKILLLKRDSKLYETMSRAARQLMREEYSWEKSIGRHLEAYGKLHYARKG